MSLGELGGLLLAFAPVVAGLAWLAHLIFRKDLASQALGKILSYFVGVIIIFFAVGWLIDTFLISWVNERLQTTQQSEELQELNSTIDDIIEESFDEDGTSAVDVGPQPEPTAASQPVPAPGPGNNGGGSDDGGGPVQADPVTSESGPTTYIVQRGDTLIDIAEKFGVTLSNLRAVNPNVFGDTIYEGQELNIPAR